MTQHSQIDGERMLASIRDICAESEFLLPDRRPSRKEEVRQYVVRGRRRLAVVASLFKQFGYRTMEQPFSFESMIATNALFMKGEVPDGALLLVGHHDYMAGLGAEDNASALSVMLELGRCLEDDKHKTVFASFDLEELGLVGSQHFVATLPKETLKKFSAVVALECLGSGKDIVICRSVAGAESDTGLVSALADCAARISEPITTADFTWFNSDHVPFARRGVRTAEICSYNSRNYRGRGPDPNVNVAHSMLDIPEYIQMSTLTRVGTILLNFARSF